MNWSGSSDRSHPAFHHKVCRSTLWNMIVRVNNRAVELSRVSVRASTGSRGHRFNFTL